MLTVEIKINGALIGHLYMRNTSDLAPNSNYECFYTKVDGSKSKKFEVKGYKREKGAELLVKMALEEIVKER